MRALARIAAPVGLILLAAGASGAVYNFSAALQNISATAAPTSPSTVSLSVFDPALGAFKQANIPINPGTFDLVSANGVAAWSSGNTVYCYTYDPIRTNWIGTATTTGTPTFPPQTAQGVVAWTVGNAVYFRVYDRARTNWINGAALAGSNPTSLTVSDGVVAWSTSSRVEFYAYDPARGQWVGDAALIPATYFLGELINTNGVVAWNVTLGASAGNVYAYAYDPTRGGWRASAQATGPTFDLQNANGVVAWSTDPLVYYQVYDPSLGQWRASVANSGFAASLAVSNSTVFWNTVSGDFIRGYNPAAGQWQANILSAPLAYFSVSTNAGNAPLLVYFIDMSIGGATWSWNFGENGATSTERSPAYRYTNFNRYTVSSTVTSAGGASSSTNGIIRSDIVSPSGSVVINNGEPSTSNPLVTLRLAATDNSGVVSSNRFSNDNAAWSAWENYSTNKIWMLTNSSGTRTVYVQFSDRAANISATATDTITLDITPPPTVSFVSTNVAEGAGTATIQVGLSHSFNQTVWANYSTSDGSAAAGVDYTAASGLLQFNPGMTLQSFTVIIAPDSLRETNETVMLNFGGVTNAVAGPPGALVITDDDPPGLAAPRINGSGQFQTTLLSAPGQRLAIQISSTLTNWTVLSTITNVTGTMQFVDPTSPGVPVRFYRTVLLP